MATITFGSESAKGIRLTEICYGDFFILKSVKPSFGVSTYNLDKFLEHVFVRIWSDHGAYHVVLLENPRTTWHLDSVAAARWQVEILAPGTAFTVTI